MRFAVLLEDRTLLFPVRLRGDDWVVTVPPLKGAGEFVTCKLEVIVNDRYFEAWETRARIEKGVEVKATARKASTGMVVAKLKVTPLDAINKRIGEIKQNMS